MSDFFFLGRNGGSYLANKRVYTAPTTGPWAHSLVIPRPAKSLT